MSELLEADSLVYPAPVTCRSRVPSCSMVAAEMGQSEDDRSTMAHVTGSVNVNAGASADGSSPTGAWDRVTRDVDQQRRHAAADALQYYADDYHLAEETDRHRRPASMIDVARKFSPPTATNRIDRRTSAVWSVWRANNVISGPGIAVRFRWRSLFVRAQQTITTAWTTGCWAGCRWQARRCDTPDTSGWSSVATKRQKTQAISEQNLSTLDAAEALVDMAVVSTCRRNGDLRHLQRYRHQFPERCGKARAGWPAAVLAAAR